MKRRMLLTALSMILMLALLLPGCTEFAEQTNPKHTSQIHYIQSDPYVNASERVYHTNRTMEEELDQEQLSLVLPEQLPAGMTASGSALYIKFGEMGVTGKTIYLHLDTDTPKRTIYVTTTFGIPSEEAGIREMEPASSFNGVPFRLFEYLETEGRTQLKAFTSQGTYYSTFSLAVPNEEVEQAKAVFEETLMCFYNGEEPKWGYIEPRYTDDYLREVTWEEAQKDSLYGGLIPQSAPEGYVLETGTRARTYGDDYLQLIWKRTSEISGREGENVAWKCELHDYSWNDVQMRFPEDWDSHMEKNVIYEIEQLTQPCRQGYLDDISSGLKRTFGVKAGDKLLWITSAGDAQWVKEQLYGICGMELFDPWECESWNGLDEEYYQDAEFGAYLPRQRDWMHSPSFLRHQSKKENCLTGQYTVLETGGYIDWHISYAKDSDADRLVDIDVEEAYSLSGYGNPWDYRTTAEYWETMRCPLFLAEEVTLETVSSRVYHTVGKWDIPRMQFEVLYGDVIVSIHAVDAAPEQVYELIDMVRTGADS